MRAVEITAGALAAIAVVGSVGTATPAYASNYGIELNGTYRVISNGDWAQTNQVFMDEKTVVQTWTITSSCVSPIECSGEVKSDQGWTAPVQLGGPGTPPDRAWFVNRVVPNWEPCPDGTAAAGRQEFQFWGMDELSGQRDMKNTTLLAGRDTTHGPSGACGINKQLFIDMPLRMDKIS
jgi:hypothetical protein